MAYLILFPLLGGTIGWLTNYMAIKFLFWPHRPIKIAGFIIQGVIPRRREMLALAVGDVVANELLSHNQIAAAVSEPEMMSALTGVVSKAVVNHFRSHAALGLLPALVRESLLSAIGQVVTKEIKTIALSTGPDMAGEFAHRLNVSGLIKERLLTMDWLKIEAIVFDVAGRELKFIELMGGLLGALIGVVQALVVLWMQNLGFA